MCMLLSSFTQVIDLSLLGFRQAAIVSTPVGDVIIVLPIWWYITLSMNTHDKPKLSSPSSLAADHGRMFN